MTCSLWIKMWSGFSSYEAAEENSVSSPHSFSYIHMLKTWILKFWENFLKMKIKHVVIVIFLSNICFSIHTALWIQAKPNQPSSSIRLMWTENKYLLSFLFLFTLFIIPLSSKQNPLSSKQIFWGNSIEFSSLILKTLLSQEQPANNQYLDTFL